MAALELTPRDVSATANGCHTAGSEASPPVPERRGHSGLHETWGAGSEEREPRRAPSPAVPEPRAGPGEPRRAGVPARSAQPQLAPPPPGGHCSLSSRGAKSRARAPPAEPQLKWSARDPALPPPPQTDRAAGPGLSLSAGRLALAPPKLAPVILPASLGKACSPVGRQLLTPTSQRRVCPCPCVCWAGDLPRVGGPASQRPALLPGARRSGLPATRSPSPSPGPSIWATFSPRSRVTARARRSLAVAAGGTTEAVGDAVRAWGAAPLPAQQQQECGDVDCQEPSEVPCNCFREPPPESPDINQLPPSILLKIFSNLSLDERCLSASLVCKYWRDLCLDFQFWKQLDLSSRQQVTDELLEKIASRSQNIIEINISDCRSMSDTGVCVLAFKCPGLLRYTAYRCKQLSDTSIIAVASHCPLLQKVHVGNQDKLTDEGLKQLGSKCRELQDIHFGQCYQISDEGMVVIAKGCLKLQRIYMQENKLVTDQSVKAFAEHCPELQYVGFMGCSVTSKGVIHLTKLRNLSSLDLRHITELDNETVMEIVKRCKNLSSLNLCLNWIINDRCVEVIAKEGQNLKELYLVSCKITDYALIAIGRHSMTIETVDVGWCKEITDQGATLIAQSSKSLRYLGLMRCDKVNEVTVEQLVQQYPHITFSTVLQDCKRTLERAYQMGWTPNMSAASS
ncbi:F-box/LRR-repeat protein 17 [Echinops telfairi]|uniref:F-box/LRR-repeat protein 17 n=1 Tax=Echinops telfairi TaxID=9371 RepID=A0ABM0ISE5_ECHTE|nr:F-box/LRR-repeat protein 17 [Echinops telfairi]